MRTLTATVIGLVLLGMLSLREAEASSDHLKKCCANIRVREVSRQMQPDGLSVVYEIQNASVDRWDLLRVEVHLFDQTGRRIGLLRPTTSLTRLEWEDVDFIRVRIPSELLPQARLLEIRIFLREFFGFPVADPLPLRLDFAFPLEPRKVPTPLRAMGGRLRVEPAGMVEWSGGSSRAILLRLLNESRHTLSEVILEVEISGVSGPLQQLQLPVTPKHLPAGAEAYLSVEIPKVIVERAKGISLQAFYLKEEGGKTLRYVEDLEIRRRGGTREAGRFLNVIGAPSTGSR